MTEEREAVLSPCGRYRYLLTRRWSDGPPLVFVMLNPSTADALVDDPTIRRCRDFARREGFAGLTVVNLFALRSPHPRDLLPSVDPVGGNVDALINVIPWAERVVVGWGKAPITRLPIGVEQIDLVRSLRPDLYCLKLNGDGSPQHPLYIPKTQPLIRWPA